MNVTLIKPNIGRKGHSLYVDEGRMEPLQLGILAALTPDDVGVNMYDDRMERIDYDKNTDLAVITVETFTARRAYEIAAEYKKRGVKVLMGGMHPMLIPEEAAEHADVVCVGDAEYYWDEVINDLRTGSLKKKYVGGVTNPQPNVITRRDLFEGKGYLPITLLQFSRGCNFGCAFCATSRYFKKQHTCRPVDEVLKEIEMQKRKLLFFVDDNIVANPEKAKELFRQLIPLKIKWVSQGSLNMVNDLELLELMAKSGCVGNVIGFESISNQNMIHIGKAPNILFETYNEPVRILREYGFQTWAAFTLGYDGDTSDSLWRTYDFAMKSKFAFAAYNILMPYPNTPLYKRLESENRLLYGGKWWLHEDYRFNHASFIPKNFGADEFTQISFEIRKKYNSFSSIAYRAFDRKTHMKDLFSLMVYLQYNPVFRKEVFKKQDMKLGLEV